MGESYDEEKWERIAEIAKRRITKKRRNVTAMRHGRLLDKWPRWSDQQGMAPPSWDRRTFLQSVSATALLAAIPGVARGAPPAVPQIGVQLYTLRGLLAQDLTGTLAGIAKIGIRSVEPFPAVYNRPAAELGRIFTDAGLHAPSGHFDYDKLEAGLDYAQELGLKYMVCSVMPDRLRNYEGFVETAAYLNTIGAKAKKQGLKLAYHNHNFEFLPITPAGGGETTTGLALLLNGTNPELVHWEEDCYWVAQSGNDPLQYLKKYSNRVGALHLKDRRPDARVNYVPGKDAQFFTEVGTGTISWPPILEVARQIGALMFIEQDVTSLPPLESLAISYRNLQKMLAAE